MILFKGNFAIEKTSQSGLVALVMTINTFEVNSFTCCLKAASYKVWFSLATEWESESES